MATETKKPKKEEDFKYLVIVESPAKAKTLTKILGKGYLVKSSVGHIRDLPAKGLGIDVKESFEPTYEILSNKQKVVDELNKYAKKAEKVYLASDPDREGEAIAWHLSHILKCPKKNMSRVAFNQITPTAVRDAVSSPRDIDKHLVDAQQARRLLDRLVGYKISPILWRKIGGRSAGRVQSIAVRLICEREEEIQAFNPQEYWSIKADLNDEKDSKKQSFEANLVQVDKKRVTSPLKADSDKTMVIKSEEEVQKIIEKIKNSQFSVSAINNKPGTRNPHAPFKTSTLQRAASNSIGYSVKKTMQVAQSLYEGVKLGRAGDLTGLITYMRTDSLRIADEAVDEAKKYILNKWGEKYYPETPNNYDKSKKKKKKDDAAVQDAHEAIRPTYIDKTPESIKQFLNADQFRLYTLIWERFISSQMTPMKTETKSVEISPEDNSLLFRASSTKKIFPGYSIVFDGHKEALEDEEKEEESSKLPESIDKGNKINVDETKPNQHFTEPPPRYNEASLVKTLEELGIGRPSTYAPTVATVVDRKYVEKLDNRSLAPTRLGINVNKLLVEHFGQFINVDFTSGMEENLDKIADAENKLKWNDMLAKFYYGPSKKPKPRRTKKVKEAEEKAKAEGTFVEPKPEDMGFIDVVKKASTEIENVVIPTEYNCPECDSVMNLKSSRFGPFLGCSNYPDCKTIINLTKEGTPAPDDRPYTEENCPKCEKESLVIRYGRYGDYLACTTEDCGHTSPLLVKLGIHCPREGCPGEIVEKKSRFGKVFYGCSSWSETKCEEVYWYPPIKPDEEKCGECGKLLMYKTLKRGDKVVCSDVKGCGYDRLATIKDQEKYKPGAAEGEEEAKKSVFSIERKS